MLNVEYEAWTLDVLQSGQTFQDHESRSAWMDAENLCILGGLDKKLAILRGYETQISKYLRNFQVSTSQP